MEESSRRQIWGKKPVAQRTDDMGVEREKRKRQSTQEDEDEEVEQRSRSAAVDGEKKKIEITKEDEDLEEAQRCRKESVKLVQTKAPWFDPDTGEELPEKLVEEGMQNERENSIKFKVKRDVAYDVYERALKSGKKIISVKAG